MDSAALYMRLSKEDEKGLESASIENQRKILRTFCAERGIEIYGEYADDGYSGTSISGRPAFAAMMEDIDLKRVNIVLTKDLSRLGRNAGETGALLDEIFPRKRVRFISVTEGIDTFQRSEENRILLPVKNLTNELYSADISLKIRSALRAKMERGEYIGSFAPFGYKKSRENKNLLVPNGERADIVREIFAMAESGERPGKIAEILNEKGAASPSEGGWSAQSVGRILRNEVYIGSLLQGKTQKPSYKGKYSAPKAKSEWIRVENTHEAIVGKETFFTVRRLMKSRRREGGNFSNIFSGTAFCADCGRALSSAPGGRLVCGGYKAKGKSFCTSHSVNFGELCGKIKKMLSEALALSGEEREALFKDVSGKSALLKELSEAEERITALFADKYEEKIPAPQFEALYEKYEGERKRAEEGLKRKDRKEERRAFEERLEELYGKEPLTREEVLTFIEKIEVHEGEREKRVDVRLKFTP